jgi:hypothetical protein
MNLQTKERILQRERASRLSKINLTLRAFWISVVSIELENSEKSTGKKR